MKVFLSSTYEDLIEYRNAAKDAIERLDFKADRMEVFGARSEEPLQSCLNEIAASDIFVGIYAHRYGFIPEGSEISITELEFNHAKKRKKPIFAFIIDEKQPWLPSQIETDPGKSQLEKFKRDIRTSFITEKFTTTQDIAIKIATSLANHIKKASGDVQVAKSRNDSERVRRLNKLEDGILFAAHDLQKRLYNLVRREGYVYLDAQNPMDDIAPSTLYRLGQYFAWVVIWLKNRTDAESLLKTKSGKIFSKMEEISKGFSSDTGFPTQTLRIFTDAQSELGEYLLEGADTEQSCISRYKFNSRLTDPEDDKPAFEPIRDNISYLKDEIVAGRTDRLNYIQNKLIDLQDILDPEQKKIDIDRERL